MIPWSYKGPVTDGAHVYFYRGKCCAGNYDKVVRAGDPADHWRCTAAPLYLMTVYL